MLSSSREPRLPGTNFLRAETPGVAPVRTGLRSRIRALVAGTPARCPVVPLGRAPRVPAPLAEDPITAPAARAGWGPPATSRRPPRARGNADGPAGALDPSPSLWPIRFRGPWGRAVAAQRGSATPSFAPKGPSWPHQTDPSFMLQCCNVSATEGEERPRSQTKHKNWCVTHLLGYLQPPNCVPGVFLAEAVRCVRLFFPRKKMD